MSNLCSEIAQVSTPSTFKEDLSFETIGEDICCNLGSINIAQAMADAPHFEQLITTSIRALDRVSRVSDLNCAPSVEAGNAANHAVGLGAMNLHGFWQPTTSTMIQKKPLTLQICFSMPWPIMLLKPLAN